MQSSASVLNASSIVSGSFLILADNALGLFFAASLSAIIAFSVFSSSGYPYKSKFLVFFADIKKRYNPLTVSPFSCLLFWSDSSHNNLKASCIPFLSVSSFSTVVVYKAFPIILPSSSFKQYRTTSCLS